MFISLDGLNFEALKYYVPMLRSPHPQGLTRLLKHSNSNTSLIINNPTITSSSHTTTISCTTAEKHGIYANSQWNGSKFVSGFSAPTATETFASSLKNSGLKVVTAGYPALDQSEPGRTVSSGFAYGDSIGQSKILTLKNQEQQFHAWRDKQNAEIGQIVLERKPDGTMKVSCKSKNCWSNLSAKQNFFNIRIRHKDQVYSGYVLNLKNQLSQFYVSQLATNKAFPKETSATLDQCGIVFSPGKDLSLAEHGAEPIILGMKHRLNFFANAWTHYLPKTDADAIFMYLEDIDSLRHQFAGDKDSEKLVVQHLEEVDRLLGDFISSLPKQSNVVIMGDHGMSTIWRELNIRKILPAQALNESIAATSGGTLMLYSKKSQSKGSLTAAPTQQDLEWLNEAKRTLNAFRLADDTGPVFEKIFIKGSEEMKQAGLAHPDAPFLIAFANERFGLRDATRADLVLSDSLNPKMPTPTPRGQHGHFNLNPTMKSFLAVWGPELDKLSAQNISTNSEVVPAIAKALNWPVPSQCQKEVR